MASCALHGNDTQKFDHDWCVRYLPAFFFCTFCNFPHLCVPPVSHNTEHVIIGVDDMPSSKWLKITWSSLPFRSVPKMVTIEGKRCATLYTPDIHRFWAHQDIQVVLVHCALLCLSEWAHLHSEEEHESRHMVRLSSNQRWEHSFKAYSFKDHCLPKGLRCPNGVSSSSSNDHSESGHTHKHMSFPQSKQQDIDIWILFGSCSKP